MSEIDASSCTFLWQYYLVIAGALLIVWNLRGRQGLKVLLFEDLFDLLFAGKITRKRRAIEMALFVSIGTFLAAWLMQPTNATQSFVGGLAWTFALIPQGTTRSPDVEKPEER